MRIAQCLSALLLLCCLPSQAEVKVGLFGVLCNVHGYNEGQTGYVPLLGLADWAGAAVEIDGQNVQVTLNGRSLHLAVGSGVGFTDRGEPVVMFDPVRRIGGRLCVPARFWETLGVSVDYQTPQYEWDNPTVNAADLMDSNPVFVFSHGGRTAVVLVHFAPPDVVAKVVSDFENSQQTAFVQHCWQPTWLGRYGIDWVTRVNEIEQGHFSGGIPAQIDDIPYTEDVLSFWSNEACIYGIRNGRWRVLVTTQSYYRRSDWIAAGIPLSLARNWQHELR